MKPFAWILLVANLAVAGFFVGRDYLQAATPAQNLPLNAARVSLRGQADSPTREAATTSPAALCMEWRGLSRNEFSQVREQLKAMAGEHVMSFTEVPVSTRYWVIFPPLPSAQSAVDKLGELAAAGLRDAFVVTDGAWRNAISLGLYATDESARRRVREIEAKGVLGTQVELQPRQGTEFYFVIRSEDPDALKGLGNIKQAYPNSRQSRVACSS